MDMDYDEDGGMAGLIIVMWRMQQSYHSDDVDIDVDIDDEF